MSLYIGPGFGCYGSERLLVSDWFNDSICLIKYCRESQRYAKNGVGLKQRGAGGECSRGSSKVEKKGIVLHKIIYYISKIIGNPVTTPNRYKTARLFNRSDGGRYYSLVPRQFFLINHGSLKANNPRNLLLCRLVVTESLFNQEKTKLGRFSCSLKEASGLY